MARKIINDEMWEITEGEKYLVRPAPPTKPPVSQWDLRSKFTDDELELIDNYQDFTLTKPQKAKARTALKNIEVASNKVDLSDNRIKKSIQTLETVGLITAGRAMEILA